MTNSINDHSVKINILGVGITRSGEKDILEHIFDLLNRDDTPSYLVTPNPEIIVYATKYKEFRKILNQARIAIPDGIGVVLAALILGTPLPERITGTDLMIELCKESVKQRKKDVKKIVSIGLLGGRDGVAVSVAERLLRIYPNIAIGFVGEKWSGNYPTSASGNDSRDFLELEYLENTDRELLIKNGWWNGKEIDLLFVAFGFPKQEKWMAENVGKIPFRLAMGVGGAFDFVSGKVPRAPRALQAHGFEWLYRLIRQPWRWKRQLALFRFGWLVLKARFGFLPDE